jgi:hypothetical protein
MDENFATYTFNPWLVRGDTRRRTSKLAWKRVETWNRKAACFCGAWDGESSHEQECPQRDRPRVAVGCDIFEDWGGVIQGTAISTFNDVRRDFFAMIDRCQNLDFVLRTGCPEHVRRMWPPRVWHDGAMHVHQPPRSNVCLLCSASDQASLDAGLPHLLACRDLCPVLGLNLELVGPVDLSRAGFDGRFITNPLDGRVPYRKDLPRGPRLDWVRVGGQIGLRVQPCDVAWIRSIVEQCRDADVPCYVPQLGSRCRDSSPGARYRRTGGWTYRTDADGITRLYMDLKDRNGEDPEEWPSDLRVRQWPRS